jgi:hypothetical protein
MGHRVFSRGDPKFWGKPAPVAPFFALLSSYLKLPCSKLNDSVHFFSLRLDDPRTGDVRPACSHPRNVSSDSLREGSSTLSLSQVILPFFPIAP